MTDPIQFHTDLYRRDAVESAAVKYRGRARIDIAESGPHLVARIEPLARDEDRQSLVDEFCNDVFSATATQMRNAPAEAQAAEPDAAAEPPWALLAPFGEGTRLPLGWSIESLSPVRAGAATLVLAHAELGSARIAIRRNGGAPMGVAHTERLDFMLMNGGSGGTRTEESVGRVLIALARALASQPAAPDAARLLAALRPHSEMQAPQAPRDRRRRAGAPRRAAHRRRRSGPSSS